MLNLLLLFFQEAKLDNPKGKISKLKSNTCEKLTINIQKCIKANKNKKIDDLQILFFKIPHGEIERGRKVKICICALTLIF